MTIKFEVPGNPVAKGRPRFANRGKFVRVYTPKKTTDFEKLVGMNALNAGVRQLSGAITAEIKYFFELPKSKCRKRNPVVEQIKTTKPDIDNCVKSILDGLNKIAFSDDSIVWKITAEKWHAAQGESPRTEITLTTEK